MHNYNIMKKYLSITALPFFALILSSCVPPATQPEATQNTYIPMGTSQTYVGTVGSRSAIFILTWQPDGNVTGQYNHPDDGPSVVYQLRGSNTSEGQLVLTEYTGSSQSAIITLKKSISQGLISWNGKMHNTDGRVMPVSLTRRSY